MESQHRQQIMMREGTVFPSATYKKIVLEPAYDNAKLNFIKPMMEISFAHAIMLVEQGIIQKEEAIKIVDTLKKVNINEYENSGYDPAFEDLFFKIEDSLIKEAGDIAGNIHIARSRNDMGIAIYRMSLRDRILQLIKSALNLRKSLIEMTAEHINTVMIGYTHTQQAQPTTLGHYLNAMTDMLTRDIKRLFSAYATVNRSSMGAAALTTTGFSINRERMMELLGFEDMIDNSWDAVAGSDYIGETATAVQLAGINLGRSAQDFLLWGTQEFGAFKLSAPYVQVSSIMPQKRNPVGIEHIRSLSSTVVGNTQTVLTMIHNTPFGDIVDTEDDMQPFMWKAMEDLGCLYDLLSSVLMTMDVDKEKLLNRAKESFANVTELADTLVRTNNLPFRKSHAIISSAVRDLVAQGKESLKYFTLAHLNSHAEKITGQTLNLCEEELKNALNPVHFVQIRKIAGGPSPERMVKTIEVKTREQDQLEKMAEEKKQSLKSCSEMIEAILTKWTSEDE